MFKFKHNVLFDSRCLVKYTIITITIIQNVSYKYRYIYLQKNLFSFLNTSKQIVCILQIQL